jgi:hypothetical protein
LPARYIKLSTPSLALLSIKDRSFEGGLSNPANKQFSVKVLTAMLPVSSLLNPIISEPRSPRYLSNSCSSPYHTALSTRESPQLPSKTFFTKQKMTKDGAVFAKGKIKGDVNFPPFEDFDAKDLQEIQRYKIYPLGKIEQYCRHIPYNSEKKSFLEKTGRESFEGRSILQCIIE